MTKRGYKQTPEHIARRIKSGPDHPNWAGGQVSRRGGRARALRMYADQACQGCGAEKADRHHADSNTANNEPENIEFLCRPCHAAEHKRLGSFRSGSSPQIDERIANLIESAAAEKRARTKCRRKHPLSGENLYVTPEGKRVCKKCRAITKQKYLKKIKERAS